MRKIPDLVLDRKRPRRRRWRYSNVLTITLGLVFSPLVYEASLLCVAQWRGIYGTTQAVHTPVIDKIASVFDEAREDIHEVATPLLRHFPWKPSVVIPCAVVWTGITALLLRRS